MKFKSLPHNFIVLHLAFVIAKCASLNEKKKILERWVNVIIFNIITNYLKIIAERKKTFYFL